MTVGVGIPDSILQEMIASLTITNKTLVSEYLKLIEQDISATKAAIDFHKGVGMFQENCARWAIHLEVYERLHGILIQLIAKNTRRSRS